MPRNPFDDMANADRSPAEVAQEVIRRLAHAIRETPGAQTMVAGVCDALIIVGDEDHQAATLEYVLVDPQLAQLLEEVGLRHPGADTWVRWQVEAQLSDCLGRGDPGPMPPEPGAIT